MKLSSRSMVWGRALSPGTLTFVLMVSFSAIGADKDVKQTETPILFCPVAGIKTVQKDQCPSGYCARKVTPKHSVAYGGGKVCFCCGDCVPLFEKAPEKYALVANHQLVATSQARQIACPSCGSEVSADSPSLVLNGITIRFSSNGCKDDFAKIKLEEQLNAAVGPKVFAKYFSAKKTESKDK